MPLVNARKFGLPSVPPRGPGTILLGALLAINLLLAALILRSFWTPIVFAVVIGIGFYPLHAKIGTAMARRNLSALLSVLAVLLILLLPLIFVSSIASSEVVRAAQRLRANPVAVDILAHSTDRAIGWLSRYVDVDRTGFRAAIETLPVRASQALVSMATSIVAGLAAFVGQAILMLFILFFVFRDGRSLTQWLVSLFPAHRGRILRLFVTIRDGIFANLVGVVVVAVVQGLLTGLGFLLVGLPSPILFGVAAAAASIIPFVGTAIVSLPASLVLFATGHWVKAIALLAWGLIVVGTSDNIIRPFVVMQRVKLHPLLLFFALLGGAQEFGFVGLFVGPLVMSVIFALVQILREKPTESAVASQPLDH